MRYKTQLFSGILKIWKQEKMNKIICDNLQFVPTLTWQIITVHLNRKLFWNISCGPGTEEVVTIYERKFL